jgi:spore coat polysaccharide biosynthesis predicted glycosyltransferase SpsG
MDKRLLIRVDAGFDVGYGHAIRVDGLLQLLKTRIAPIVVGTVSALPPMLAQAEIHPCPKAGADLAAALSTGLRPDAILVDLPRRARFPWHDVRKLGVPLIAIDDEGGEVEADLIVNGTVPEEYHQYNRASPATRYLIGPRYTLIRPAFANSPWHAPSGRHVLIIAGSGERATAWARKLVDGGLADLERDTARLVVGASFPDVDSLRNHAREQKIEIFQGLDAARLANLMAQSSVAVLTGGMVVFEALAVGVPVIVFPQIDNAVPAMRSLAAHGCVCDLGYDGGLSMENVRCAIEQLLSDSRAAASQSAAGRAIVDGQGSKRVATVIDEMLR